MFHMHNIIVCLAAGDACVGGRNLILVDLSPMADGGREIRSPTSPKGVQPSQKIVQDWSIYKGM